MRQRSVGLQRAGDAEDRQSVRSWYTQRLETTYRIAEQNDATLSPGLGREHLVEGPLDTLVIGDELATRAGHSVSHATKRRPTPLRLALRSSR